MEKKNVNAGKKWNINLHGCDISMSIKIMFSNKRRSTKSLEIYFEREQSTNTSVKNRYDPILMEEAETMKRYPR